MNKKLTEYAIDNGINWTSDLIGNADMIGDSVDSIEEALAYEITDNKLIRCLEDNEYYGTPDDIDWWETYIKDNAKIEHLINEVKAELDDVDELDGLLSDVCDDYETHASNRLQVLQEYVSDNNIDVDCNITL